MLWNCFEPRKPILMRVLCRLFPAETNRLPQGKDLLASCPMKRVEYSVYILLWVIYGVSCFIFFPRFNSNICLLSFPLLALPAWKYGAHRTLLIVLTAIPFHMLLFSYYANILELYQGKALGIGIQLVIIIYIDRLKTLNGRTATLTRQLNKNLEERTRELNHQLAQLLTSEEESRRNLGQNIHDGLGQYLTSLMLYSSFLQTEFSQKKLPQLHRIEKIAQLAKDSLQLARKASRTLFPLKMMNIRAATAFDELIAYFSQTTPTQFNIRLDGDEEKLPEEILVHFYRITYECIFNSIRHKIPERISIHLSIQREEARLSIKVEGCLSPYLSNNSMPMSLIRYRMRMVDGRVICMNQPGETFSIECQAPLTPAKPS